MEFDCPICGTPIYASPKMRGCTMFCEDCESKPDLIEWYRQERRKKLEAMNHATQTK